MKNLLLLAFLIPSLAYPASVQVTGGYLKTQTVFPVPTTQMTLVPVVTPGQAFAMTMCDYGHFSAPSLNDPCYEIVGVVGKAVKIEM